MSRGYYSSWSYISNYWTEIFNRDRRIDMCDEGWWRYKGGKEEEFGHSLERGYFLVNPPTNVPNGFLGKKILLDVKGLL